MVGEKRFLVVLGKSIQTDPIWYYNPRSSFRNEQEHKRVNEKEKQSHQHFNVPVLHWLEKLDVFVHLRFHAGNQSLFDLGHGIGIVFRTGSDHIASLFLALLHVSVQSILELGYLLYNDFCGQQKKRKMRRCLSTKDCSQESKAMCSALKGKNCKGFACSSSTGPCCNANKKQLHHHNFGHRPYLPYLLYQIAGLLIGSLAVSSTRFQRFSRTTRSRLVVALDGTRKGLPSNLAHPAAFDLVQHLGCFSLHLGVEGVCLCLDCCACHD